MDHNNQEGSIEKERLIFTRLQSIGDEILRLDRNIGKLRDVLKPVLADNGVKSIDNNKEDTLQTYPSPVERRISEMHLGLDELNDILENIIEDIRI